MSKTIERPPEIYSTIPIPTDGRSCKRYVNSGGEMVPCTNDAEYVFVYEKSTSPDDDTRGNCVACESCTPEVTV